MNSQSVSVTFPISFLNSCLNVIGVATRANDSDGKTPGYDDQDMMQLLLVKQDLFVQMEQII